MTASWIICLVAVILHISTFGIILETVIIQVGAE